MIKIRSKVMKSRIEKYNDEASGNTITRTQKNAKLYNDISDTDIDSFDVNSNATILGSNATTINIDKLRDMLDKKYREEPVDKSMGICDDNREEEAIKLAETREYDINEILEKAKETKDSDYEVERLKKLRNTQVDILNDLKINSEKSPIEQGNKTVSNAESTKLMELINTINITEATQKISKMDPLDLLSDLKGNDDATVVGSVDELKESINEVETKNKNIDSSFYTTSNMLTQSDFDDFNDLKEEVSSTKIIIKVLIFVVILAFICGAIFLLNRILGWGLF